MIAVYEFFNKYFWIFLGLTILTIKVVIAYKRQKASESNPESDSIPNSNTPPPIKNDIYTGAERTSEKMNLSSYYVAAIPMKCLNVYSEICKLTILEGDVKSTDKSFLVMMPNQKWAIFASEDNEIPALSDKYLAAISKFSGSAITHFSSSVSMVSGLQYFENGESKYWVTFDGEEMKTSEELDQDIEDFINKYGVMKDAEFDISLKLFEKYVGDKLDDIQISKRFKVASPS